MRLLALMRGVPSSGKSTFIKENGLEQYTLSADEIRLLFQSPVMNEQGKYGIEQKHDKKVWKLLFELLEERMKRGEFTIVDATHSKSEMIARYKKLAEKYRYRVVVVDFSHIHIKTLLRRNSLRPEYKQVPESAILNHYERMSTEKVQNWVDIVKPDEFMDYIKYNPINLSKWKKIHHIGDIHGCYTALKKYVKYIGEELKEDELYIFTGDYLDRGLENVETLKYLLTIYNKPNVILLEGNHERHLRAWANDDEIKAKHFINSTKIELDNSDISKKDVRQFCRKLRQLVYYTYNDKTVVVTHGGIAKLPENLMFMATDQFIDGVGGYGTDIDNVWEENEFDNIYQIHGHRNIYRLSIKASNNSYNLEGQVEKGGCLRIVTLSENGFEFYEVKNDVFKISKDNKATEFDENVDVETLLEYLRSHDLIKEKELGNNISSFNFTREAFRSKNWDGINLKARGLFVNTKTNEIVSRSYNKFFNINEVRETKIDSLADNLKFPVYVYRKENGYLGIVGYNSETDELVFSSKSETNGQHAEWLKELFLDKLNDLEIEEVKHFLKESNVSLVFEVIKHKDDQHIIKYEEDKLVLLDIVKRTVKYEKMNYDTIVYFANRFNLEYKELDYIFHNWIDLYKWYRNPVTSDIILEIEGYVLEDSSGFMTKIKLPYYNFWKQMRGIKDMIQSKHVHNIKTGQFITPLHNQVFSWLKQQDIEHLKNSTIIELRDEFYNSFKK